MAKRYILKFIHAMEIGAEYYVDKNETKEEFETLEAAMKKWYFLNDHTNSTVFEITFGDKIYSSDDFYKYCEDMGWD